MDDDVERVDTVEIDLSNVESIRELHKILQEKLDFPYFYGRNWNAFWDAVTGLVVLPYNLVLDGWVEFSQKFPKDAEIMKRMLSESNEMFPRDFCNVVYR